MATQQVRMTTNFDTNKDTRKQMDYNKTAIVPTELGSSFAFPYLMSKLSNSVRHRWEETCFPGEAVDDYSNYNLSNLNVVVKNALMIPKNSAGSFGRGKFYFYRTTYYDSTWPEKRTNYNGTNNIGIKEWSIFNGGNQLGKTFDFIANNDDVYVAYVPVVEIASLPSSVTKELSSTFYAAGEAYVKLNEISSVRRDYINNLLASGDYVRTRYSSYDGNFVTFFSGTDTARNEVFGLYPSFVVEHDGYYVAEVDVDGNYTNRLVEQQGTMYESFSPYSIIDYMTNSRSNRYLAVPGFEVLKTFSDYFKEDDMFFIMEGNKTSVIIKKEVLIRYLNYVGIPWTFDKNAATNTSISNLSDGYNPNQKYYNPSNPPGQPDDTAGGGDGTGDNTSNEYSPSGGYNPLHPTSKQYVMDSLDVDIFQSYLWEPSAWQSIQELWGDAWGAIISLKYYPFSLIQHDGSNLSPKETIKIGKVSLSSVGNISQPAQGMPMKPDYNCRFDLGEFKFEEYYGSFMDYEPYTSISIFLPFIGWRDIGTNDVMGKVLKVHYIVDFNTGNCTAYLTVNNGTNEFLYNQYQGTIGIDLPLSKNDFQQKMLSMGVGIMSASLSAAVQANGLKSTSSSLSQSSSNTRGASDIITNNANKRLGGSAVVGSGRTISLNNSYNQSQSYMASNRSSSNESITKTDPTLGMVNGFSGAMSNFVRPVTSTTTGTVGPSDSLWLSRKPIIRIERPIKSEASSFEENQGRPANITKKLADMTGYVECLNPVINFKCNESERAEIAALLQGGIYL